MNIKTGYVGAIRASVLTSAFFVLCSLVLVVPVSAALSATTTATSTGSVCYPLLAQNLKLGDIGTGVIQLQRILNIDPDTQVATSGKGAPGYESSYYGLRTSQAVMRFQQKYFTDILKPVHLTKPTGTVGGYTRAKLTGICSVVSANLPADSLLAAARDGFNHAIQFYRSWNNGWSTGASADSKGANVGGGSSSGGNSGGGSSGGGSSSGGTGSSSGGSSGGGNSGGGSSGGSGSTSTTTTATSTSPVTSYTISSSAGTGGSIAPSGSVSVTTGNNKTYTVSPNPGYQISLVTVDGTSVGAVSSYKFNNVTSAHTITATFSLIPVSTTTPPVSGYPLHQNITATVFWAGEPQGGGSSENNAISAWDDTWEADYGGFDDYSYIRTAANNYFPTAFTPKENPFYLDLPYNDFNDNGTPKSDRATVVPWASQQTWTNQQSMMKNQWVMLTRNGNTCYGQIEDAGPYVYDDSAYVFGPATVVPKSTQANNAGMDVSPALRDCLGFSGLNNAENKVSWQFVTAANVPQGPWKVVVTTSQVNWQ